MIRAGARLSRSIAGGGRAGDLRVAVEQPGDRGGDVALLVERALPGVVALVLALGPVAPGDHLDRHQRGVGGLDRLDQARVVLGVPRIEGELVVERREPAVEG